jgi:Pvc16 N-terminal domain
MTAHFAVPATTFVLKALCEARLKAAYGVFPAPPVKLEPPPRPAPTPPNGAQPEPASLYLFLHHAAQNPAWRNMHEPTVNALGQKTGPAPLVLDLYYLMFATGADLEREVLFSLGLMAFRRNGIVPRPMIQAILGAIAVPANPAKLMETLTAEPLHDPASQPEQITISQEPYDLDRSTKLWSALQAPLRPTALFQVTTLFLDVPQQFPATPEVDALDLHLRPNIDPADDPAEDFLEVTS